VEVEAQRWWEVVAEVGGGADDVRWWWRCRCLIDRWINGYRDDEFRLGFWIVGVEQHR
jgi:hypothetical protein